MAKKEPIRHCMGCNGGFEKSELLRIVKFKDGNIMFDDSGKAQGRGAYICRKAGCLAKVQKSRRINRVFKSQVSDIVYKVLQKEIIGSEVQ